jgi:hypothetical protein
VLLLGPVPDTNYVGAHSRHCRKRRPRIGPVPHRRLRRWPLPFAPPKMVILPAQSGFSPPYDIPCRGLKPARVSVALGGCKLLSGADLPQADRQPPSADPEAC